MPGFGLCDPWFCIHLKYQYKKWKITLLNPPAKPPAKDVVEAAVKAEFKAEYDLPCAAGCECTKVGAFSPPSPFKKVAMPFFDLVIGGVTFTTAISFQYSVQAAIDFCVPKAKPKKKAPAPKNPAPNNQDKNKKKR